MFWRFLVVLGGSKIRQKTKGNSPKNHGSGKAVFGDGFWTVKCCKNTVNTDVFERPCAENTVNTVVFGATCKKPRTYRVFCAFWLKSIGIYGAF